MALISCPECERQVSDSAQSCPGCGVSISGARQNAAAGARLHTVQETSKRLKLHQLGAIAVFVVGVTWLFAGFGNETGQPSGFAILLTAVGTIWYCVARFRVWWHHK